MEVILSIINAVRKSSISGGKNDMSTRAIIGIQNNDGTITGAWQWNDGMNIASLLRREFDTLEKAQELIKNGVWNNIISQKKVRIL